MLSLHDLNLIFNFCKATGKHRVIFYKHVYQIIPMFFRAVLLFIIKMFLVHCRSQNHVLTQPKSFPDVAHQPLFHTINHRSTKYIQSVSSLLAFVTSMINLQILINDNFQKQKIFNFNNLLFHKNVSVPNTSQVIFFFVFQIICLTIYK